jgi:hypothetical protein
MTSDNRRGALPRAGAIRHHADAQPPLLKKSLCVDRILLDLQGCEADGHRRELWSRAFVFDADRSHRLLQLRALESPLGARESHGRISAITSIAASRLQGGSSDE